MFWKGSKQGERLRLLHRVDTWKKVSITAGWVTTAGKSSLIVTQSVVVLSSSTWYVKPSHQWQLQVPLSAAKALVFCWHVDKPTSTPLVLNLPLSPGCSPASFSLLSRYPSKTWSFSPMCSGSNTYSSGSSQQSLFCSIVTDLLFTNWKAHLCKFAYARCAVSYRYVFGSKITHRAKNHECNVINEHTSVCWLV